MNKGYPAMMCPKKGHRSNPTAALGLSSTFGHATTHTRRDTETAQPAVTVSHPPLGMPPLTLILRPVQLNHKFVHFFLIHNT